MAVAAALPQLQQLDGVHLSGDRQRQGQQLAALQLGALRQQVSHA